FSHRFDWGNLSVSADRAQSLSDDRVDMSLPRVNLSLRPVTLFQAPASTASWYNNMTWNGSANFGRKTSSQPTPAGGFSFSTADATDMSGNASSSFTMGRFSLGQSVNVQQRTVRDVPPYALGSIPGIHLIVDTIPEEQPENPTTAQLMAGEPPTIQGGGLRDIGQTDVQWSTSIGYQQPLIGTTTLTPSLSLSGSARKADTVDVARNFVSSPTRISFGARLKADLYGFYGGVGNFQAIRHKLSPGFSYDWAPEVQPTALQERVFGSSALQRRSTLSITLNQTWEGKRKPPEEGEEADSVEAPPADSTALAGLEAAAGEAPAASAPRTAGGRGAQEGGPRRLEQGEIVNILSIQTSAVRYDFVKADEGGDFVSGFETTTLNNTISSDYLRGLSVNMTHDLFEETPVGEEGETERRFAPHLSRLNFGFTL
ncbi:MAG TPA: putative LPS assembly protein LptD, partial [Longimicrobiales bacterium]|nr:putative LPS assembly protein LptD [Longimicrobiales bacterium]